MERKEQDVIDLEILRVTIYNWVSNVNVADDIWGKVNKELDKAREEGRGEVLSKIKEIFETSIPRGLYSPSETSYLYERFVSAIQQYYIEESDKLNNK